MKLADLNRTSDAQPEGYLLTAFLCVVVMTVD